MVSGVALTEVLSEQVAPRLRSAPKRVVKTTALSGRLLLAVGEYSSNSWESGSGRVWWSVLLNPQLVLS